MFGPQILGVNGPFCCPPGPVTRRLDAWPDEEDNEEEPPEPDEEPDAEPSAQWRLGILPLLGGRWGPVWPVLKRKWKVETKPFGGC